MPRYAVELSWTVYKTVVIDAEDEDDAWDKASEHLIYQYGEEAPADIEGIHYDGE